MTTLLLHGVGETPQAWHGLSEALLAECPGEQVAVPWLRGLEPGTPERFALAEAAEQVLALDSSSRSETSGLALVGGSLGAVVALDVAVRAPARVSRLVLSAGQVHPPPGLMKAQQLVFANMPDRVVRRMGLDKERLLAALDAAARIDYRDQLASVAARTLVVVGGRDRANRPAAEQLAAGIPGARLEVLPGAGHRAHVDAPEEFNRLVVSFLVDGASC